ncbi:MAG: hypothetical protein IT327_03065 [Anaerolineae bacterium]|nr:hypothetical protein [Anaerolineae bacterium]
MATAVDKAIERALESKQPVYSGEEKPLALTFTALLRWAEERPPDYGADTRKFDEWHERFLHREPHLNGVVGQATSLIRNRGWSMTGGKIQVNRTKEIFHDADRQAGARFGDGYRRFITRMARSFYIASFGAICELGRDAPPRMSAGVTTAGPLRAMWSADPTRFKVRTRGSKTHALPEFPLAYYPAQGKMQHWRHGDFLRIVDNPSIREDLPVGYSAVAMARELAEILVAVYKYDKEKLGARAPKGLIILNNITEDQWNTAMKSRRAELDGLEREYFGDVAVLAGSSVEQVDAKLMALSSLPEGFKRQEAIDLLMYLYALLFRFPPEEFWPVRGGSFGRGTETQVGVERATRKGDMDFFSAFQEQMQKELPAAVLLEYEERDDRGRHIEATISEIHAKIASTLYQAGALNIEGPLLTRQQALSYLVANGVIPPEWSEAVEDVEATDTEVARMNLLRERLLDTKPQVHRAIAQYPDQPIVRYQWPSGREIVLWERGDQAIKRSHLITKKRAVLYRNEDADLVITDEDVDTAVAAGNGRLGAEFAQLLEAPKLDA